MAAATGIFPLNMTTLISNQPRIFFQPAKIPAPAPTPTTTGTQPPLPRVLTPPTTVFPVNVDPGGNTPQPVSPLGTGGGFVPSGPTQPGPQAGGDTSTPGTTGAGTGGNLGGSGSTGSDRVLDLIGQLLQPQNIQQPLTPSIVDSGPSSSGTNPMALVILAIAVIGGIFWFANRKKRAA